MRLKDSLNDTGERGWLLEKIFINHEKWSKRKRRATLKVESSEATLRSLGNKWIKMSLTLSETPLSTCFIRLMGIIIIKLGSARRKPWNNRKSISLSKFKVKYLLRGKLKRIVESFSNPLTRSCIFVYCIDRGWQGGGSSAFFFVLLTLQLEISLSIGLVKISFTLFCFFLYKKLGNCRNEFQRSMEWRGGINLIYESKVS